MFTTSPSQPLQPMSDHDSFQEIACADRASAEREAAQQQQSETDPSVEWIYLRNTAERWVARRVPRDGPAQPPSRSEGLVDGAIGLIGDMFLNW